MKFSPKIPYAKENRESALIILSGIFVGSLVISEVLASKIIALGRIYVPAGVLAYAVTFAVSDVVSEIWGKKRARQVVLAGFFSLGAVFLLIWFATILPSAPFWTEERAFTSILGMEKGASRIILASVVAYLVSQYHDVWAFHFWRKLTGGRHLWLRNNASTLVSQAIDTCLFIFLAFYGVFPVLPLILGQYFIKLCITLLDTPVVYGLVHLLKRSPAKVSLRLPF